MLFDTWTKEGLLKRDHYTAKNNICGIWEEFGKTSSDKELTEICERYELDIFDRCFFNFINEKPLNTVLILAERLYVMSCKNELNISRISMTEFSEILQSKVA